MRGWPWPGLVALALVLLLTLGTLAAVALRAEAGAGLSAQDWAALRFTVVQAALSAGISVLLAVPLARALMRRRFPGRALLVALLGAPFILPVIVAVMGLIAVFGRTGLIAQALEWAGLPPPSIYGMHGVILAHVFFNLPLATRILLQGWQAIPAERFRLAATLGFGPGAVFRHLEWPMLRALAPGAFLVIFLVCTTSFAVALTLGGGPRATTVELAIYQAFRFDFDLARACLLAVMQFVIGGLAALMAFAAMRQSPMGIGLDRPVPTWPVDNAAAQALDWSAIGLATLLLLAPMIAVGASGILAVPELSASVFAAAGRSLAVALGSTALAMIWTLTLALWVVRSRAGPVIEAVGYLTVAASPLVIGTGLFILLLPVVDPVALSLPVTALVNAFMALPFALRVLVPAVRAVDESYGRLAASLALTGWTRLRLVTLPRIRRPLGFAAGLTAALSMGDLGVVALFSSPDQGTLPLQVFRLMSAYRGDAAAAAALLLMVCAFALFWAFDRGGRVNADA